MSEFINYLNSPHLVANFQKLFGIESHFGSNLTTKTQNGAFNSNQSVNKNIKKRSSIKLSVKDSSVHIHSLNTNSSATSTTTIQTNEIHEKLENCEVSSESFNGKSNSNNSPKKLINITDHRDLIANTFIHNRFWYYFFHLGAAMGNEIFYCLFFPFWFWNVDGAIARKVAILWGAFMYVGQATKDILCMPRPASPPVVKLEERYFAEYGFPSTHAMVSAGLPISVLVLSYSRYNIDLQISIAIVVSFCCWVCCSRLYLGMHSILDVVAGVLYSILILLLVMPILEPIDKFILESNFSPFLVLSFGYLICHFYPALKQWSTARGDTTIIIGSVAGFSVGSFLNNRLGLLNTPDEPPLYDIHFPNALGYIFGICRTILGLLCIFVTRQFFKTFLFKFLCFINGLDYKNKENKKIKKIELPYNYITYFAIGVVIEFAAPLLFRMLNIQRDYSYTEI